MKIHTDAEVEEKILDCIENKEKYVEWLCQNQTEKQLRLKLKTVEELMEYAVKNKIARHCVLIELWKDQFKTALKNLLIYEDHYKVFKKIKAEKKQTSSEKMMFEINFDWINYRLYDVPPKIIKLEEAILNADFYIEEMNSWDDAKRIMYLDLLRKQIPIAYKQGDYEAFELFKEYERQVIESWLFSNID